MAPPTPTSRSSTPSAYRGLAEPEVSKDEQYDDNHSDDVEDVHGLLPSYAIPRAAPAAFVQPIPDQLALYSGRLDGRRRASASQEQSFKLPALVARQLLGNPCASQP
jgi:hypothetical protein